MFESLNAALVLVGAACGLAALRQALIAYLEGQEDIEHVSNQIAYLEHLDANVDLVADVKKFSSKRLSFGPLSSFLVVYLAFGVVRDAFARVEEMSEEELLQERHVEAPTSPAFEAKHFWSYLRILASDTVSFAIVSVFLLVCGIRGIRLARRISPSESQDDFVSLVSTLAHSH